VAFSPRVGKKEEREIHWRYGLVSVRVEQTTWSKKREKREKKKRAISSRLFSLGPLRNHPNPDAGNGLDFLRLGIFYH